MEITCLLPFALDMPSCLKRGETDRNKPFPCRNALIISMISRKVGGLEPFSAGLAVGGGMVLSALWSGREVHLAIDILQILPNNWLILIFNGLIISVIASFD